MSPVKWKVNIDAALKRKYGESLVADYKGEQVIMYCPDSAILGHRAAYVITCVRTGEEISRGARKSDVYEVMRFWIPSEK